MNNNRVKDKPAILECKNLVKTFIDGHRKVAVLHDLDWTVDTSDLIGIIGASGSGKSTLLHLLGGLDKPTSGQVLVNGQDIHQMTTNQLAEMRNRDIGFVYQFHHLLMEFSALENVMMPLLLQGIKRKEATERAQRVLEKVGLSERVEHRPSELSGGERQRVAIARALVTNPKIVLADEPTGNLDQQTAAEIFNLIKQLNQQIDTCFVMVTHDLEIAKKMEKVYRLNNGHLEPVNQEITA